jgi:hypothetical protein
VAIWGVGCALLLVAVAGMVRDVRKPYKTSDEEWARTVVRDFVASADSQKPVVIMVKHLSIKPTLLWYIYQHRDRLLFQSEVDWNELAKSSEDIWTIRCWTQEPTQATPGPLTPDQYERFRPLPTDSWTLLGVDTDQAKPDYPVDPTDHWDVYRWRKAAEKSKEPSTPSPNRPHATVVTIAN